MRYRVDYYRYAGDCNKEPEIVTVYMTDVANFVTDNYNALYLHNSRGEVVAIFRNWNMVAREDG